MHIYRNGLVRRSGDGPAYLKHLGGAGALKRVVLFQSEFDDNILVNPDIAQCMEEGLELA